jgi:Ca-activated chloride channel family protein
MAIAIDTSGSMEGEMLQSAKQACESVIHQLRPQDRAWVAAFSTKLIPLLEGIGGGASVGVNTQSALSNLKAEGVTRTDYALDWIGKVLESETGGVRVGILITDGHATDPRGNVLSDLKPLVDWAGKLGSAGIVLYTIGLGNADKFNVAFLDDLGKGARGAYVYASEPPDLGQQLGRRLSSCQTMAIEAATLSFRPLLKDVHLAGLCRIRPDFVPMDLANSVKVGNLRADVPTEFLVSVTIPPRRLDQRPGTEPVLAISLDDGGTAGTREASIEYTVAFSRAQQVDPEVNLDRLNWDINSYADAINRTSDTGETGELLSSLGAAAQKAGQEALAQQAFQQLEELKSSGKLSAHRRSQVLVQSRNLGGSQ